MTQPNKEVVMPDANASCASIDAYIQEFYQPGSAECLEKQTLEDFCGCQEPVCRVCSSPTATMMLPNKVVPVLARDKPGFKSDLNRYQPKHVSFKPKPGMFIIFPGFLDHGVSRNLSSDKRISLSFNFSQSK